MKYSLRSLMIVVLVLPPLLAVAWFGWQRFKPEEIFPSQVPDTGITTLDGPPPCFEAPSLSAQDRNPPRKRAGPDEGP